MTHTLPSSVKPPSKPTLRKYGITETEWISMWVAQGEKCPICEEFKTTLVIDHQHYKNFKKLPPEVRRSFIRGIVCTYCNQRIIGRGATVKRLLNGAKYLRNYERRRKELVK